MRNPNLMQKHFLKCKQCDARCSLNPLRKSVRNHCSFDKISLKMFFYCDFLHVEIRGRSLDRSLCLNTFN